MTIPDFSQVPLTATSSAAPDPDPHADSAPHADAAPSSPTKWEQAPTKWE